MPTDWSLAMPTSLQERLAISMKIARRAMGGQPPQSVVAVGARALARLERTMPDQDARHAALETAFRDAILAAKSVFGQPFDPAGLAVLLEETVGGLSGDLTVEDVAFRAFDSAAVRYLGESRDKLETMLETAQAAVATAEQHVAAIAALRAEAERGKKR